MSYIDSLYSPYSIPLQIYSMVCGPYCWVAYVVGGKTANAREWHRLCLHISSWCGCYVAILCYVSTYHMLTRLWWRTAIQDSYLMQHVQVMFLGTVCYHNNSILPIETYSAIEGNDLLSHTCSWGDQLLCLKWWHCMCGSTSHSPLLHCMLLWEEWNCHGKIPKNIAWTCCTK